MPTAPKVSPKGEEPDPDLGLFRVEARHCGFRAGVDVHHVNRSNDEFEAEDFRRERRRDIDRREERRR